MITRIVSGGQTGADRGGLNAAIALGIPHGGWCPKGRRAEDGKVPSRYGLQETGSSSYQARTRRNVLDSDGTVIFTRGALAGGSLLTQRVARQAGKPCVHFDLRELGADPRAEAARLRSWLAENQIRTLNVAGSRESKARGIQAAVGKFLQLALGIERIEQPYIVEDERLLDRSQLAAAEPVATYGDPSPRPRRKRRR